MDSDNLLNPQRCMNKESWGNSTVRRLLQAFDPYGNIYTFIRTYVFNKFSNITDYINTILRSELGE